GTSGRTPERIRNVARRLVDTQREGSHVVAVISAMAGVTGNLVNLAHQVSPHPTERELDILLSTGEHAATALTAMAVNALGGRAISLSGAQAGILTDRSHTNTQIVLDAKKLKENSYDELLEMAGGDAKVMQSRAVEFAKKFGVEFEVLSSFKKSSGTITKEETPSMEDVVVRGISLDRRQAKLSIAGVRDEPGIAGRIFSNIAAAHIIVDMIVQNASIGGATEFLFRIYRG